MNLAERDTELRELMDDPNCDLAQLRATLRRFGIVNQLVAGWGAVYRQTLRPTLAQLGRPARILDLGCGGGDLIASLSHLAQRDGFAVDWLGIDPEPTAIAVAQAREKLHGVHYRLAESSQLLAEGESFDVVVSNHVLHHLDSRALSIFAAHSLALSSGIVLHSDIERGRLAYALYNIGITPLAPGTFLRTDGLRSIRRSYRADELASALGQPWRVHRPGRFRLLASAAGSAVRG